MNEERKLAVLRAGIIPPVTVSELARWGVSIPEGVDVTAEKQEILEGIREAIESKGLVELRMTDLDAKAFFTKNEQSGRLYYAAQGGTTFINISFALTELGHCIIPWTDPDDDLTGLMLSSGTYIKPRSGDRIYFCDAYELHYGEQKAFLVCIPGTQKVPAS